jgi:hypothetical protein
VEVYDVDAYPSEKRYLAYIRPDRLRQGLESMRKEPLSNQVSPSPGVDFDRWLQAARLAGGATDPRS